MWTLSEVSSAALELRLDGLATDGAGSTSGWAGGNRVDDTVAGEYSPPTKPIIHHGWTFLHTHALWNAPLTTLTQAS